MTCTKVFGNQKQYNIAQQENVNLRCYIHHAKYFITFHIYFFRGHLLITDLFFSFVVHITCNKCFLVKANISALLFPQSLRQTSPG